MQSDAPAPKLGPSPVLAATVAAAAMIAQHVIGRATRDALFLSHFSPSRLPVVMIGGAVVSALVVLVTTRLLQRRGPERVVPAALVAHAALALLEWALASRYESAVAIAVYLHTASVGATLVSSFWSLVGESFDPHAAKQVVGRIGAGAALGGVVGGALAWASASLMRVPSMLVAVAALSLVAAWGARGLSRGARADRPPPSIDPSRARASGLAALRQTPYLGTLALLVLVGALVQSLVDYTMGVAVTATYGSGARLLSFFAVFQTVIGVVSFLLQLAINRLALERLGVGRTIALLPLGVGLLGGVVLVVPSLATVALQRGVEGVLRGSLFRSAYEVLFTPIPHSRKRPTKTLIDVGFDRLGMIAGSALTLAILRWWPGAATRAVTLASVLASAAMLVVAYRLHGGYVATLAERLQAGTLKLDARSIVDATTRHTFARTIDLDRPKLLAQIDALRASERARALASPGDEEARSPDPEVPDVELAAGDDRVDLLAELRSRDAATVRRALRAEPARLRALSYDVLDLLARDDLARDAARALAPLVPGMVGTIVDAVLEQGRPLRARRRAARLLSAAPSQRAVDALAFALDAEELDVRHASGRVLVGMREKSAELRFDGDAAQARAQRELERPETAARDPRSLEHAFNVLALTFPREPMLLSYGALAGRDRYLRGVALEYLDVVLPARLRAALSLRLKEDSVRPLAPGHEQPRAGSGATSLTHLLESRDAIQSSLAELRGARDPDAD